MCQVIIPPLPSKKGQMLTTTIKWPLLRAGELSQTVTLTTPHIPRLSHTLTRTTPHTRDCHTHSHAHDTTYTPTVTHTHAHDTTYTRLSHTLSRARHHIYPTVSHTLSRARHHIYPTVTHTLTRTTPHIPDCHTLSRARHHIYSIVTHTLTRTTPHIPRYIDKEASSKTYLYIYQIRRRHSQDTVTAIQTNLSFDCRSGHKPLCVNLGKRLTRAGSAAASLQKGKEILCSWIRICFDVNLLQGISIVCSFHIYTRRVLADI